jgi:hypothetical protein
LSGPTSGLVITFTPAGRFVYWPDRKPADLISGDSRYVAYIDSLPFQEGSTLKTSPLTSSLLMLQQTRPLQTETLDVSVTGSAANVAGALRDNFPVRNLAEALEEVESRVHTTPEQYLMSITTIARQAQGIRDGEVIAKLAEDAYFMWVDNRVNQPPPARHHDNEATSRSANNDPNRTRAELPAQPNHTRSNAGGPPQGGNINREVVPHRAPAGGGGHDPDGGGSDGGSYNHGANRRAGGGGRRGGRGHANSHASGASQGSYDARQKIEELRRKKSTTASDNDGFPAFSPRLRNLLLPDKFKHLGISKYSAK